MILENHPRYSFVPSLTWSYDGGSIAVSSEEESINRQTVKETT